LGRSTDVEQQGGFVHLVGLERPDHVQFDIRKLRFQRRPFGEGFLHAILAVQPMARRQHRADGPFAMRLGHGDQPCGRRRLQGGLSRCLDAREDVGKIPGDVVGAKRHG
jgi:hypothetical protein